MTRLRSSRVAAPGACALVLVLASCSAPYTPELEVWPATPDASSSFATFSGYDASVVDDAPGLAPVSPGSFYDGPWYISPLPPPVDAGSPTGPQPAGMDASPSPVSTAPVGVPDAAPHVPPDAGPPRAHAATIVVTTIDDLQCYSPQNVGAIWIAQSSGAFVKTLQVWAKTRIDHLTLWNSVTKAAGLSRNSVDAITGATQQSFGTHVVYWNFTDTTEKVVPDGAYRVYIETTDQNVPGPNTFISFTKSTTPATFTAPDTPNFTDLKVVVTP